jgi:hypothetical protein
MVFWGGRTTVGGLVIILVEGVARGGGFIITPRVQEVILPRDKIAIIRNS